MILPLSLYGAHSLNTDLHLFGNLFVYHDIVARDISNRNGIVAINDLFVADGLNVTKNEGVADISLNIDGTLQYTPDGQLSVVPHILLQSDLEMKASAPIKLILDSDTTPGDVIGSTMTLDYDPDSFKVDNNGRLKSIETEYKGFGGLKIGGIGDTDFDFLPSDLDLPKLKGIRLQTSDDFTQAIGSKLCIKPKGIVGSLPYYSLSGLDADESLYYNSIGNTLSVPRIFLNPSMLLTPEDAVSKYYLDNWLKVMYPLQKIEGEISLKVDDITIISGPTGLSGNYKGMYPVQVVENEISLQIDDITIISGPAGLTGNYKGMYPVQVLENEISLQVDDITIISGPAGLSANYKGMYPVQVLENEISLQVDDITIISGPAGLSANFRGGNGIMVEENIISLSPATEEKIDQTATQAEELQTQTEEIQAQVEEIQGEITALTAQIEAMGGALAAEGAALEAEVSAALGAVVAEGVAISAEGALIAGEVAEGQAVLTSLAAGEIGAILAAAATAASVGTLLAMLGKKTYTTNIYNSTVIGTNGISHGAIEEGTKNYIYGYSIVPGNTYNSTLYPYLNTAPCTVTPLLGSDLQPVASTDPYSGMLTVLGGVGISQDIYAGGSIYSSDGILASQAWTLSKGYITNAALSPYSTTVQMNSAISSALAPYTNTTGMNSTISMALIPYLTIANAASTYQPIVTAGTGLTKTGNTLSVNALQSQITQVGNLTSLTVSGASVHQGKTQLYGLTENWQSTTIPPSQSLQSGNTFYMSNTAPRQTGFSSGAVITNLNLNPKVQYGTTTYNGVTYPTLYAGNYTVSGSTDYVTITSFSGGWIQTGVSLHILRGGSLIMASFQITNTNSLTSTGTFATSKTFSTTVTLQDGDAVIPSWGMNWNSVTTYAGYVNMSSFSISGLPTLNAWDMGSNFIQWYPDIRQINKISSSLSGITLQAPGVFIGTDLIATQPYVTSSLVPYATTASVNTGLASKESILTFSAPLNRNINTISIDLTSYYTKTQIDSTVSGLNTSISSKEVPLTFSTPLSRTNNTISIDLTSYYTKTQIDSTVSGLNTSIASKEVPLTFSTPLSRTNNTISIDLTSYYTKTQIDSTVSGLNTSIASKEVPLTFSTPLSRTNNTISIDLSSYATIASMNSALSGKESVLSFSAPFNRTGNSIGIDLSSYYTKTQVDNTVSGLNTSIASKEVPLTFSTPLSRTNNTISIDLTSYATQTSLTNGLSGKQGTITPSAPLALSASNVLSIDLSSFATKAYVDSQDATKQNTLTFSSPLSSSGTTVSLNQSGITSLGTLSYLVVSGVIYPQASILFGSTVSGKEGNAGRIGYQIFSTGLDIVGAGTAAPRLVSIWEQLMFPSQSLGSPTLTTRNAGTRIILYSSMSSTTTDYAIGINATEFWCSVDSASSKFRWYGGATNFMQLDSTGLSVTGNVTMGGSLISTQSWVTSQNYLTSASLTGYATQSWVTGQNYLTSASLTGYATQSWVTGQNYLTSASLTGYATTSWVQSQGYVQSVSGIVKLTPPTNNAEVSIGFSANTDYSGTNFVFGRASWGLGSDYIALGATAATSNGVIQQWDRFGNSTISKNLSVGLLLTVDNGILGAPQFSTRSNSTRIILWSSMSQNTVDYALGMESGNMWFSCASTTSGFKWYGGTTQAMSLTGAGLLSVANASVTSTASIQKCEIGGGGNSSGVSNTGWLDFSYYSGGGYRHFVRSRHDASGLAPGNSIDFWLNTSTTATGSTLPGTGNVQTVSFQATSSVFYQPVSITSTNAISYNWSDLTQSVGGAMQVEGDAKFNGVALFTGKTSYNYSTSYRWYNNANSGNTTGVGNYSVIIGPNGRLLVGSEMDVYSDLRLKEQVEELDDQKALEVVSNTPAKKFRFKNNPSIQRFGLIAQDMLKEQYLEDMVSVVSPDGKEENERYVVNGDTLFVLWAAVRELSAEVKKLKSKN